MTGIPIDDEDIAWLRETADDPNVLRLLDERDALLARLAAAEAVCEALAKSLPALLDAYAAWSLPKVVKS